VATYSVDVEREIPADPHAVWRVLTDVDSATQVLSGITAIERVDGAGYEPGVSWRETRKIFGKSQTELMKVVSVDEPTSTSVVSESSGTTFTTTYTLTPTDTGTLLKCEFRGEPGVMTTSQKIMTALFSTAGMNASRKLLEQDLADISAALKWRM